MINGTNGTCSYDNFDTPRCSLPIGYGSFQAPFSRWSGVDCNNPPQFQQVSEDAPRNLTYTVLIWTFNDDLYDNQGFDSSANGTINKLETWLRNGDTEIVTRDPGFGDEADDGQIAPPEPSSRGCLGNLCFTTEQCNPRLICLFKALLNPDRNLATCLESKKDEIARLDEIARSAKDFSDLWGYYPSSTWQCRIYLRSRSTGNARYSPCIDSGNFTEDTWISQIVSQNFQIAMAGGIDSQGPLLARPKAWRELLGHNRPPIL